MSQTKKPILRWSTVFTIVGLYYAITGIMWSPDALNIALVAILLGRKFKDDSTERV